MGTSVFYMLTVLLFLLASQPFMMLMVIVAQGLSLMILMSIISESPWATMTIFLLYLGGVLVVFLYVNSFLNQIALNPPTFLLLILLLFLYPTQKFLGLLQSQEFLSRVLNFNEMLFFFFAVTIILLLIYLINSFLFLIKSPLTSKL